MKTLHSWEVRIGDYTATVHYVSPSESWDDILKAKQKAARAVCASIMAQAGISRRRPRFSSEVFNLRAGRLERC
jgi:hypothetical protein